MRPIKFRAWLIEHDYMNFVEFINYIHDEIVTYVRGKEFEFRPGEYELMQYTGLKDKNGTEIYEGDLVNLNGLYEVKFGEHGVPSIEDEEYVDLAHGFYFKAQHDLKDVEPFGFDIPLNNRYSKKCKVIGNLYENPELLEGDK